MNAAEAITRLLEHSDNFSRSPSYRREYTEQEQEDLQLATAVVTAMLNTMLPIARFRAFVEVERSAKKTHPVSRVTDEFTICAVSMKGIRSGIAGVSVSEMEARITIFEQTSSGATMVSGFQGSSKSQRYRMWYNSLDMLEQETPAIN